MRVRYSFSSKRTGHIENMEKQRRKYPDIVDEIIKVSDIILEVLDARFFQETRNIEIEDDIKKMNKTIIYVLNKSDLADLEKTKLKLKELKLYPYVLISCTKRTGSTELRNKIKIESKRIELPKGGAGRVQVGIIGYPNTGKSSLINFLTGSGSAKVGAEAGFTKGIQKVRLTDNILVLDTPGVIPTAEYSSTDMESISKHAKVSARDFSKVRDPEYVVATLMKDYAPQIEELYKTSFNGDSEKLIEFVGRSKNLLKKGGVVDEDRAARVILKDWQEGRIKV